MKSGVEHRVPLSRKFDDSDFDLELVDTALAQHKCPPVAEADIGKALLDLHLAEGAPGATSSRDLVVMTAAAILFANDPRRLVPGAAAHLVRRPGTGSASDVTAHRMYREVEQQPGSLPAQQPTEGTGSGE